MSKNSQWLKNALAVYAEVQRKTLALLESDESIRRGIDIYLQMDGLPVYQAQTMAIARMLEQDENADLRETYNSLSLEENIPVIYRDLYANSTADILYRLRNNAAKTVADAEGVFRAQNIIGTQDNSHSDSMANFQSEILFPQLMTWCTQKKGLTKVSLDADESVSVYLRGANLKTKFDYTQLEHSKWGDSQSATWQDSEYTQAQEIVDLLRVAQNFDFSPERMNQYKEALLWPTWQANSAVEPLGQLNPAVWSRAGLNDIARSQEIINAVISSTMDESSKQAMFARLNSLTPQQAQALIGTLITIKGQINVIKNAIQTGTNDRLYDVVAIDWGLDKLKRRVVLSALNIELGNEFKPEEIVLELNFLASLQANFSERDMEMAAPLAGIIAQVQTNLNAFIVQHANDPSSLNRLPIQNWSELTTLAEKMPGVSGGTLAQSLPSQTNLYGTILSSQDSVMAFLETEVRYDDNVSKRLFLLQNDCDDPKLKEICREKLAGFFIAALKPDASTALKKLFLDLKIAESVLPGMKPAELSKVIEYAFANDHFFTGYLEDRHGSILSYVGHLCLNASRESQQTQYQTQLIAKFVTEFSRCLPLEGEKIPEKLQVLLLKFFSTESLNTLGTQPLVVEVAEFAHNALAEIFRTPESLSAYLALTNHRDDESSSLERLINLSTWCNVDPQLNQVFQSSLYAYTTNADMLAKNPDLKAFFTSEKIEKQLMERTLSQKCGFLLKMSQTQDEALDQLFVNETDESLQERYAFARDTLTAADSLKLDQSQRESLSLLLLKSRNQIEQREQAAAAAESPLRKFAGKLSRSSSQSSVPDLKETITLIGSQANSSAKSFLFVNRELNMALAKALKPASVKEHYKAGKLERLLAVIVANLHAEDFQVQFKARHQLMALLTSGSTMSVDGVNSSVQAVVMKRLANELAPDVFNLLLKECLATNKYSAVPQVSKEFIALLSEKYTQLLNSYEEKYAFIIRRDGLASQVASYHAHADSVLTYLLVGNSYQPSELLKEWSSVEFLSALADMLTRFVPSIMDEALQSSLLHDHLIRLSQQPTLLAHIMNECASPTSSLLPTIQAEVYRQLFSDNHLFTCFKPADKAEFFISAFNALSVGTPQQKAAGIQLFHTRFDANDLLAPLFQTDIDVTTQKLMPAFFSKEANVDLFIAKLANAPVAKRITTLLNALATLGVKSSAIIDAYDKTVAGGIYGLLAEGFNSNDPNVKKLLNEFLIIDIGNKYTYSAALFAEGNDQKEPFKTVINAFLSNFAREFEEEKSRYRAQVATEGATVAVMPPSLTLLAAPLTPLALQKPAHEEHYQKTFIEEASNLTGDHLFMGLRSACERQSVFSAGEKVYNINDAECNLKTAAIYDALHAATNIPVPLRNLALALAGTNAVIRTEAVTFLNMQLTNVKAVTKEPDKLALGNVSAEAHEHLGMPKYNKRATGEKFGFSASGSTLTSEITTQFYEEDGDVRAEGILGIKEILTITLVDGVARSSFSNTLEIYNIEKGFTLLADMRSVQGVRFGEDAASLKNLDYFNYPLLYTEIQTALLDALHQDLSVSEIPSSAMVSAMFQAIFFNAESLRDFLADHEHDRARYPDGKLAWLLRCCGNDAALHQQLKNGITQAAEMDKASFGMAVDDLISHASKKDPLLRQLTAPLFGDTANAAHLLASNVLLTVETQQLWQLISAMLQQPTPLAAAELEQLRVVILQRPSILTDVLSFDAENTDPDLRTVCLSFLLNKPAIDNRFVMMPVAGAKDGQTASVMDHLVRSQMLTNPASVDTLLSAIFANSVLFKSFLTQQDADNGVTSNTSNTSLNELLSWCDLSSDYKFYLKDKLPALYYTLVSEARTNNSRMSMMTRDYTEELSHAMATNFINSPMFLAAKIEQLIHGLAHWQRIGNARDDQGQMLNDLRETLLKRPNLVADVLSLEKGGEQQQTLLRFLLEDASIVNHASVVNGTSAIQLIANQCAENENLQHPANKEATLQLISTIFNDSTFVNLKEFFENQDYGTTATAKLKALYQLCGDDLDLKAAFTFQLLDHCRAAFNDLNKATKTMSDPILASTLLNPEVLRFIDSTLLIDPSEKRQWRREVRTHVAANKEDASLQSKEFKEFMIKDVLPAAAFGLSDKLVRSARVQAVRENLVGKIEQNPESPLVTIDTAWENLYALAKKEANAYWKTVNFFTPNDRREAIKDLREEMVYLNTSACTLTTPEKMQKLLELITDASQNAAEKDTDINKSRVGSWFSSFRNINGSRFQVMLDKIRVQILPTLADIQKYEMPPTQKPLLDSSSQVQYLINQVQTLLASIQLLNNTTFQEIETQLTEFLSKEPTPAAIAEVAKNLKVSFRNIKAQQATLSSHERSVGQLLKVVANRFIDFHNDIAPTLASDTINTVDVVRHDRGPGYMPVPTGDSEESKNFHQLDDEPVTPRENGRDSRSGSDSSLLAINTTHEINEGVENESRLNAKVLLTVGKSPMARSSSDVSVTSSHSSGSSSGFNDYSVVGVKAVREEAPCEALLKGDKWPLPGIQSKLTAEDVQEVQALKTNNYQPLPTID